MEPPLRGCDNSVPLWRMMSSTPPVRFPCMSAVKLPERVTGPSASNPLKTKAYGLPATTLWPVDMQSGLLPLGPRLMIWALLGSTTGVGKTAWAGTGDSLSSTSRAKLDLEPSVGVPEITPLEESVIPGGRGLLPGNSDPV